MLPPELFYIVSNIAIPAYVRAATGGGNPFHPVNTLLAFELLYDLYVKSVAAKEFTPIEEINKEDKEKYWAIGKGYYSDKATATKGAKAAYILDVLGKEKLAQLERQRVLKPVT